MNFAMAKTLGRTIVRHPWSSLRDAMLLSGLMAFAVLLAWRYDLFAFIKTLADPQRTISPPEAVLLTVLFAVCVYTFIARRLAENRLDALSSSELACEMRKLREIAMGELVAAEAREKVGGARDAAEAFDHHLQDVIAHGVAAQVVDALEPRAIPAITAAIAIGNRFMNTLGSGISTDGHLHELGVAIGATLLPDDGSTSEAILHKRRRGDVSGEGAGGTGARVLRSGGRGAARRARGRLKPPACRHVYS